MQIYWFGETCFKIQNSDRTILINPDSPRKAGLRGPNFKSDLLLLSDPNEEKETEKKITDETFLISAPGEYEVKGVFIEGIPFKSQKKTTTLYRLVFDEISFGFLGPIDDLLEDEQVEKLGTIDVLFLPVGGGDVLESKTAEKVLNSIEPKIVIPHSYQVPGLKTSRDKIESFLKKLGKKEIEAIEKFSLSKKELLQNFSKEEIIILQPKVL